MEPLAGWWQQHPVPARWLLAISFLLHGAAYLLVVMGLWSLRAWPGVLVVLGLTLAYLVVLPGPIAHLRFWVPAVPLAIALVVCAFLPSNRPAPHRGSGSSTGECASL